MGSRKIVIQSSNQSIPLTHHAAIVINGTCMLLFSLACTIVSQQSLYIASRRIYISTVSEFVKEVSMVITSGGFRSYTVKENYNAWTNVSWDVKRLSEKKLIIFFIHICILIRWLTYTHPYSFFPFPPFISFPPFFLRFLPARDIRFENGSAGILSYPVSRLHQGTGKRRKTYADTVGHWKESDVITVSGKWPFAQHVDLQTTNPRETAWLGWPLETEHRRRKHKKKYYTLNCRNYYARLYILAVSHLRWWPQKHLNCIWKKS